MKFGGECTEFLPIPQKKNRKNTITSLVSKDGREIFYHEEKSLLLWNAFKERLGHSEFTQMYLDLNFLLSLGEGQEVLDEPFTTEEIDKIIIELPNHKSPSPDGFNGEFLKRCWPLFHKTSMSFAKVFF